ncbi:MAG: hypothetical protein ABI651_12280 [Verrucomicrobiota bacterium]
MITKGPRTETRGLGCLQSQFGVIGGNASGIVTVRNPGSVWQVTGGETAMNYPWEMDRAGRYR